MKAVLERFNEKWMPEPNTGCWIWTAATNDYGYGYFPHPIKPPRITSLAHRVSWILHKGAIPPGMKACHKCDTPQCVNPAHLFLGTQHENILDSTAKGRHKNPVMYGSKNPNTVLSVDDIEEIKGFDGLQSHEMIGVIFGITQSHVSNIIAGKKRRFG